MSETSVLSRTAVEGPAVPEPEVREVVRRALGDATLELGEWRCARIYHAVNQLSSGVYRFSGTAHGQASRQTPRRWSVILKEGTLPEGRKLSEPIANGATDRDVHPLREYLAYQSGLLDTLPGVRAPRCYGVDEREGGIVWLWLEDVGDEGEAPDTPAGYRWGPASFHVAAHALGVFNGAYAVSRPLPECRWLARSGFRDLLDGRAEMFRRLQEMRDHPLVRRGSPDDLLPAMLRLYEERERFAQVVNQLPVTLCHRDMIPSNALVRWKPQAGRATREAEMVAIDWQHIGIDTLGRDLGSLVPSGVHRMEIDANQLPEIDAVAFDAYLDGLREAGWHGDPRRIRLAYCATAALRYGLIPAGVFASREGMTERIERTLGRSIEDWLDACAQMQRFVMRLADEARGLMDIV